MKIILVGALVCSVLWAACDDRAPQDLVWPHTPLILDEVFSWEVSDPEMFMGGAVIAEDAALAWTVEGTFYLLKVGEPAPHLIAGAPQGLLVGASDDHGALVASRTDGSLFRLLASGSVQPLSVSCPALMAARSAIATSEGFLAVLPGEDGAGEQLGLVRADSLSCAVIAQEGLSCSEENATLAPAKGFLAVAACSDAAGLLLSVSVNEGGMMIRELPTSRAGDPPLSLPQPGPLWYGLPILATDFGFLRVISDLRSHRRRFELWDDTGAHMRTSHIHEPLGFVSASARHQLLFGMRTEPNVSLVLTRWSWQRPLST